MNRHWRTISQVTKTWGCVKTERLSSRTEVCWGFTQKRYHTINCYTLMYKRVREAIYHSYKSHESFWIQYIISASQSLVCHTSFYESKLRLLWPKISTWIYEWFCYIKYNKFTFALLPVKIYALKRIFLVEEHWCLGNQTKLEM